MVCKWYAHFAERGTGYSNPSALMFARLVVRHSDDFAAFGKGL